MIRELFLLLFVAYKSFSQASEFAVCSDAHFSASHICSKTFSFSSHIAPPSVVLRSDDNLKSIVASIQSSQLSDSCLEAALALTCELSFLRCSSDSNYLNSLRLRSSELLRNQLFSFQRPCMDVCLRAWALCGEATAVHLSLPRCNSRRDYSDLTGLSASEDEKSWPLLFDPFCVDRVRHRESPIDSLSTNYSTMPFEVCPDGYVLPDHPSNPAVKWVSGTNCARGCRSPIVSNSEWKIRQDMSIGISCVGLILVSLSIHLWRTDKERRKQDLVICFFSLSLAVSIVILVTGVIPVEISLCEDNAVMRGSQRVSYCMVQAILLAYFALCTCIAWCIQSVDLCFKVVFNRNTRKFKWIYWSVIFVLPIFPVLYGIKLGEFGFSGFVPWCAFNNTKDIGNLATFFFPAAFIGLVGICIMTVVIIRIYNVQMKAPSSPTRTTHSGMNSTMSTTDLFKRSTIFNSQSMTNFSTMSSKAIEGQWEKFRAFRTPLLFVLYYLIIWVSILTFRGLQFYHHETYESSLQQWEECLFNAFDGVDTHYPRLVCGHEPADVPSDAFSRWIVFCIAGQSLFASAIYLPNVRLNLSVKMRRYIRPCVFWMASFGIFSRFAGPSNRSHIRHYFMYGFNFSNLRKSSRPSDGDEDDEDDTSKFHRQKDYLKRMSHAHGRNKHKVMPLMVLGSSGDFSASSSEDEDNHRDEYDDDDDDDDDDDKSSSHSRDFESSPKSSAKSSAKGSMKRSEDDVDVSFIQDVEYHGGGGAGGGSGSGSGPPQERLNPNEWMQDGPKPKAGADATFAVKWKAQAKDEEISLPRMGLMGVRLKPLAKDDEVKFPSKWKSLNQARQNVSGRIHFQPAGASLDLA